MPNWCENQMVVKGDPERVEQFVEQMKGLTEKGEEYLLDFEAVIPMPKVLDGRKSPSDDGSITWYDWQVGHWGVKWGACDVNLSYDKGSNIAIYDFNTPWGPAIPWQETVIEFYPWLSFTFEWVEWGMCFRGNQSGENGKPGPVYDAEVTEEEWKEYIGEEV